MTITAPATTAQPPVGPPRWIRPSLNVKAGPDPLGLGLPLISSSEVISVISDVFAPLEVAPDSRLEDLEANSVFLLRLMVALQREFDVDLDVVDMFSVDDVNQLVQFVEERMS